MRLEAFSSTVEQLYAAAADPALWGEALRAVENLTGSAGAVVGFVPEDGGTGFVFSGRFSAEQCQEYARDHAPFCPRLAFAAKRPDLPLYYDALLMDECKLDRDPVYRWFERASGVRYYLGAALPTLGGYRVDASLQRTRAQGHVQRADLELFGALKPHIAQALRLSDLVGTLSAQRRLALHMLEALPHAAIVLDGTGRMLFANPAAERVVAAGDGLGVTRGRLTAVRASDAWTVRRLVASATAAGAARGGWLRVPRPSGKPDYVLFAAPVRSEDLIPIAARPAAVLAILEPGVRAAPSTASLKTLFGLTGKEAEVAVFLARGRDLASVADDLGIMPGTARVHLKSVFRKMNLSRQQDLVALMATLATAGETSRCSPAPTGTESFAAARKAAP